MLEIEELILQNAELSVQVLPKQGGRIASLLSLESGVEFLTQAHKPFVTVDPNLQRLFRDGPCAGIEECLPTVGPCMASPTGNAIPDHGDFWQLPWQLEEAPTATQLGMYADGFSRSLRFHKQLQLSARTLALNYKVQNLGSSPVDFLYACHPLFAVHAEDRIVLPEEVQFVHLDYSRDQRCGPSGSTLAWPSPQPRIDLSTVASVASNTAEMLYTNRLHKGHCGLYRSGAQQGIAMSFNTNDLPYLGLWLCCGGWPDLPGYPPQYAVALEPTNAPCNTLSQAQQAGLVRSLDPGSNFAWSITLHISHPGTTLSEFTSFTRQQAATDGLSEQTTHSA